MQRPLRARRRPLVSQSKHRSLRLQSLEDRGMMAITNGAGPGGFESIGNANSLQLWLDAADINGDNAPDALANGSAISTWVDKSGFARNFTTTGGTVTYNAASSAGNNQPATVYSNSRMQSANSPAGDFDAILGANYTIFGISRYTGSSNQRVISSYTQNWLFGHWGNNDKAFHFNGWINSTQGDPQNSGNATALHNYSVVIGPAVPNATVFIDGTAFQTNATGYNGGSYKPGKIELGSWNNGGEASGAEISELVIINRNLNLAERRIMENALSAKYNVVEGASENIYSGDNATIPGGFSGDYDFQVFGIGRVNSSNQLLSAGQGGFGIETATITDDGDFVAAGHKTTTNGFTTSGLAGTGTARRFTRSWYVDVTDSNNNLGGTLTFDYSDAGVSRGSAGSFKLLRSNDGGTTWTDVGATLVPPGAGDTISFNLSAAQLESGLYTLGDASGPQVSATVAPFFYTIGSGAQQIDSGFTVATPANPTITGATIKVEGFNVGDTDVLNLPAAVNGVSMVSYSGGTLTLTGNGTAADYQQAIRSITYSNGTFQFPNRTLTYTLTDAAGQTGAATRSVFIAANGVQTVTWDGGGDGTAWTDRFNWSTDQVPDSNDIAQFANTDVGPVSVASPQFVGGISFTNSSGIFTLSGSTINLVGATAYADSSGGSNVINSNLSIFQSGGSFSKTSSGTTTINGLLSAPAMNGAISGGQLNLTNLGNGSSILGGVWTIASGGKVVTTTSGSNSGIGKANIDLTGGILEFGPAGSTTVNSLVEKWYPNVFADTNLIIDAAPANNTDTYLALAPSNTTSLTTNLGNFDTTALVNRSGIPATMASFGNRYGATWTGQLTVGGALPAGFVSFGTSSDDGSAVYVDLNQNHIFESTELVVDNRGGHGNQSRTGTISLAAGVYDIYIPYYESSGGGNMEARFASGNAVAYGSQTIINPSGQPGVWTTQSVPTGSLANNVRVLASSTIVLGATMPGAKLNQLQMSAGQTLLVQSPDTKQDLEFAAVLLNGSATINSTGSPDITLRNVSQSAAADLTFSGDATVALPTTNTYTGLTTINSGVTVGITADGALGTAAGGTIVQSGGSLRMSGGFAYTSAEPLTLNGNGTPSSDAALLNASGNNDFYGPITLNSSAKIRDTSGVFRLFGQVNAQGNNLELRADNQMQIATGLSGSGTITKSGGDRVIILGSANGGTTFSGQLNVNEGVWDARASNALGSTLGSTTIANNARLELYDGITLADNISVTGNSGGNGAIRNENNSNTLSGTITLTGATQFWVNDTQLTINGTIIGGQALTKSGVGTLILAQNNTLSNFDLAGGEVRISTLNGLGSTSSLSIDGGESLEFGASLNFNAGTTLNSLTVNNGTIASVSGTTTLDIPITLGVFSTLTVGGAGNLVLPRDIGNGNSPIATNFLNHYGYDRIGDDRDSLDVNTNKGVMGTPVSSKGRVSVATTANVNLLSPPTSIDGVELAPLSRVLVKNQANPAENGVYVVPAAAEVTLQNATGLYSQGGWSVANLNNNVTNDTNQGWANDGNNVDNAAVFETAANLNPGGGLTTFTFQVHSGRSDSHHLGRFRISATTDDRSLFADGLITGGDVTANWVVLNPSEVFSNGPTGLSILPDGSIIAAHSDSRQTEIFTIEVTTSLQNISGFRLEALEHPGFAANGPGTAGNGNFTVFEFDVFQNAGTSWTRATSMDASSEASSASVMVGAGTFANQMFRTPAAAVNLGVDPITWSTYTPNPTQEPGYTGQAILTSGPRGNGLNFDDDNDFIGTGAIDQADNYKNLFVGYLNVTAATAGRWTFRLSDLDDWQTMFIDLDRDGVFNDLGQYDGNPADQSLGGSRGEQLSWNDGGTKVVNLAAGRYLVAMTHLEGGGGSRIEYQFRSPTMGAEEVINPAAPSQAGLWSPLVPITPANALVKTGTGSVTLSGNNTYNGLTTVNGGTLIAGRSTALGLTTAGTVVNAGGTLALQDVTGPVNLTGEAITADGTGAAGQAGAISNISGANSFTGTLTAQPINLGSLGIGATAGTLTLNGTIDMRHSQVVFNGAGNVVVNSSMAGLGVSGASAGIQETIWNGTVGDAQNNIETFRAAGVGASDARGILSGPLNYADDNAFSVRAAALGAVGFDNGDFAALWITTFTPNESGVWQFQFASVDDNASIWIDTSGSAGTFDGSDRIYNRGCCGGSGVVNTPSLVAGQPYLLGIVMNDGGGGGYLQNVQFKSPTAAGITGGAFATINSSVYPTTFQTVLNTNNAVVKNGTGVVTLTGSNNYNGATNVIGGTLIAAHSQALGQTSAGTNVQAGGTLGLSGGITLSGEQLTLNGLGASGQPGALVNVSGNNTIASPAILAATVSSGQISIGSTNDPATAFVDTLTIQSNVDLGYSRLVVDGTGNVTITGNILANTTVTSPSLSNLDNLTDGIYSFTVGATTFSGFVDHDGTDGWLLIGRGREGWEFDADGQGAVSAVSQNVGTTAAFAPAAYSDALVNALLAQAGTNMTGVELRHRRAANTGGTLWQESRWRDFTGNGNNFTFNFEDSAYGVTMEILPPANAPGATVAAATGKNTNDSEIGGNDGDRIFTWAWSGHNNQKGFSYGSSVDAVTNNDPSNYLWEFNGENHSIPYTELYIRLPATTALVADNQLVKNGGGTLTLGGTNTYSGTTTINGGVASITNSAGVSTNTTIINNGGTFEINNVTHDGAVTLNAGGTIRGIGAAAVENGTITVASTGSVSIGTGATTTDIFTLGNAANDLTGGGAGTLINVVGAGRTQLTQASNLSAAAKWNIGSGATLSVGADNQLGAVPAGVTPDYITIAGGTLRASAGFILNVNRGITLGAGGGTMVAAAGNFEVSPAITGSTPLTIGAGAGQYIPNTDLNTYSGGTILQSGSVTIPRFGSVGAVGALTRGGMGTGPITFNGGQFRGSTTSAITLGNAINFNADTTIPTGGTDQTLTFSGPVVLNGGTRTLTTASVADVVMSGVVSGANGFTKAGTGRLVFQNANTYTGATSITGGTLSVSSILNGGVASNLGQSSNAAANLVLNGGTLLYTGAGNTTDRLFTLGTNAGSVINASGTGALVFANTGAVAMSAGGARILTLTGTNTADNTINASIGDGSTGATLVTKTGTGTFVLGGNSAYTGTTTITQGTLTLANSNALGSAAGSTIVLAPGGLSLRGNINVPENITIDNASPLTNLSGDNTLSGAITVQADYARVDIGATGQRTEPTYSGVAGAANNANNVNLPVTNLTSLTGDAYTIAINNLNTAGVATGTIDWRDRGDATNYQQYRFLGEDFIKNNAGVIRVTLSSLPAGTYQLTTFHTDSDNTQSGTIQQWINTGAGFVLGADLGDSNFAYGGVNGANYSSANIANSVAVNSFTADGINDVIIVIDGSPHTDDETPLNGFILTPVAAVTSPLSITTTAGSLSISGAISDGAGTASISKLGTGTLTLSGNNTYDGTTTINAGTLLANNTAGSATGTGPVSLLANTTLGGTGAIAGAVSFTGTTQLQPGAAAGAAGDLAAGGLTLVAGTTYTANINGPTPGDGAANYDQLVVTGNVSVAGTLTPVITTPFVAGQAFTLIRNDGSDPVSGVFSNAASEYAPLLIGGNWYHVSYKYNAEAGTFDDGNDVALIANRPPVSISAGGPYSITEGGSMTLAGTGSDPDLDTLSFAWDLDGDGAFDDATGATPNVTWADLLAMTSAITNGIVPPTSYTAQLRVSDGRGGESIVATTFTVTNAPPTDADLTPSVSQAGPGQPVTFTFTATDPSPVDQAASFTWIVNWGDGSPLQTITGPSGTTAAHSYATIGAKTAKITQVTDVDGGTNVFAVQPSATVTITQVFLDGDGNLVVGGFAGVNDVFIITQTAAGVMVAYSAPSARAVNFGPFTPAQDGRIIVFGQSGNDRVEVRTSVQYAAEIHGGDGDDKLYGGNFNDQVYGDAGNDTVSGGAGDDYVDGGAGIDLVDGGIGDDTGIGGLGNDKINGLAGNDVLYGGSPDPLVNDAVGADLMDGGDGDDILFGQGGNDTLKGQRGNDALLGGAGNDTLDGNYGNDILIGGADTDRLLGGADSDVVAGGTSIYDSGTASGVDVIIRDLLDLWGDPLGSLTDRISAIYFAADPIDPTTTVNNNDGKIDSVLGGAGDDWYLASTASGQVDKTDKSGGDKMNLLF